jgi:hypothetical protein
MQHLLFFVLFSLLALAVPGQQKLREVDLQVNGIGSGTSYSTIVKKLGKAKQSIKESTPAGTACSDEDETYLTLFYPGLEIALIGDGKGKGLSVVEIEITSKKWTASGIRIGAGIKEVKARFGQPNSEAKSSKEITLYYVTKDNLGMVNFYFRNRKLIKILMKETLC